MKKKLLVVCLLTLLLCACASAHASPLIAEGAKNAGVRYLQQELKALGYYVGEPDGAYGMNTAMSVMEYARAKGLAAEEGVSLSFIRALRADLGVGNLTIGDSGTSVYLVQKLFYDMGYIEDYPDGKFGTQTKLAAVDYMAFVSDKAASFMQGREDQRAARVLSIQADMPVAYDAPLINQDTVLTNGVITPDWFEFMMTDEARTGRDIQQGSPKTDVRRMQRRLRALGYTADTRTDGVMGDNTVRILKYFQRRNGLQETGVCDQATQRKLFTDAAVTSDQYVGPYMAYVYTEQCMVLIMEWTGDGYNRQVKAFTCSTGAPATPTAHGVFQAVG